MRTVEQFQLQLMQRLLFAGRRRARRYILKGGVSHRSTQLAREMDIFIRPSLTSGFLYLDPYWAVYFHDGRPGITRKKGEPSMIWYRDKRLDPRLKSGRTPNRAADLKSLPEVLTKEQFREAVDAGRLVIRRRVKATMPTPFFDNDQGGGMVNFKVEAGDIVQREFSRFFRETLEDNLNVVKGISFAIQF